MRYMPHAIDAVADPVPSEHHRYARGFVVSATDRPAPRKHWLRARVGDVHVSRDPRLPLSTAERGTTFVAALGMIWDGRLSGSTSQDAVDALVEALTLSEAAFLDALDAMSGRFVLIWGGQDGTHVCGDATMMKATFHAPSLPDLVASHGELVATAICAPRGADSKAIMETKQWKAPQSRYLPGAMTEWSGVRFLTANMALSLTDGTVRRIWPRRPLARHDVATAAARVDDLMHRQLSWLARQDRPLVLSLTAGIDSRIVFAIAKDVPGIRYFTYSDGMSKAHLADLDLARRMAAAFGCAHEVVRIDKSEDPDVPNLVRRNNRIPHLPHVASGYLRQFPQDAIHVRANLAEIGRAYYGRAFDLDRFDATEMARTWRRMPDHPVAVAAFEHWRVETGFDDVVSGGFGIEAPDLFYWEHRMSCWHGRVVAESDIAFDTASVFNNRLILEALLGVPRADRIAAAIFAEVIRRNAPALLDLPVNGAPFPTGRTRG